MAKSHKTVSSGGAAAGGSKLLTAVTTVSLTYANAYNVAISQGDTPLDAGLKAMQAAQNVANKLGLSYAQLNQAIQNAPTTTTTASATNNTATSQQVSSNQTQATTAQQVTSTKTTAAQQASTPTNTTLSATSSNVKAYFGNNNGGFHDTAELVANQAKIQSFMDNAYSQLKGDKTPQWLAAEAMGFNAKPNVVTSMSALPNQANRVMMYRGVSGDPSYAQHFKTGDNYPGVGIYGDGAYFQLSYAGAQSYAGTSNKAHVITCSVDTSKLRIISEPKLRKMRDQLVNSGKLTQPVRDLIKGNAITTSKGNSKKPSHSRGSSDSSLGTFATLLGYDAIYVPGGNGGYVAKNQPTNAGKENDFYVILNRGAVDVKA